ncbi:MAG: hypothetical protein JW934_03710 [Anaerolineae bacterium]|nr:hypothetical protein [Anaerolineae bacterium]
MSSDNRFRVVILLLLVLSAFALNGCIQIQVIDRTPAVSEPVKETNKPQIQEHDLAVLAVDFDPPLDYNKIMERKKLGEGITLLVAVENTGVSTENDVTVQISLSKDQEQTPFLKQSGIISSIAPGEIKIIHFKDNDIPLSYEYHLQVDVNPAKDETRLINNQKNYDLLITQP